MRLLLTVAMFALVSVSLTACIVEPAGPSRFCYYHPYRC